MTIRDPFIIFNLIIFINMNFKSRITFVFFYFVSLMTIAQLTKDHYTGVIPNSKPAKNEETTEQRDGISIVSKITKPTLTVFLPAPEKANGTAVIIFPGGGYWVNAISHEGTDVAKQFNEMGVAAVVLKVSHPE